MPALRPQRFYQGLCTADFTDNRWINRFGSRPVPDECRFTLIGHPHGCHLSRVHTRFLEDLLRRGELRMPEISGGVFHPTRLRVVLWESLINLMYHLTSAIEEHRP